MNKSASSKKKSVVKKFWKYQDVYYKVKGKKVNAKILQVRKDTVDITYYWKPTKQQWYRKSKLLPNQFMKSAIKFVCGTKPYGETAKLSGTKQKVNISSFGDLIIKNGPKQLQARSFDHDLDVRRSRWIDDHNVRDNAL